MKILIIGEKPSIAKKIVEGLSLEENFKRVDGYYESENYLVSSCVGHLLKQMMPASVDEKLKKWSFDNLPFYFDEIPLEISESSKDQFKLVKKLMERKDIKEIVNACDADREGELIFMNLIEYIKPKCDNLTRMWIESVATPEVMLKQFNERLSEEKYKTLHESAKTRAYADYFLGLNATQAMSVKFNTKLSLGRVITPTLGILVDLEKKIQNFTSLPFYKVLCDTPQVKEFSYINADLDNNRFEKKDDALKLIEKVGKGNAVITLFEEKKESESAPKLFSLSDLQIECSKKYKMSAQEVLDSCQALYEHYGLTTYPRTSENMISKEMADRCPELINSLSEIFNAFTNEITDNKYNINSSCVAKKDLASHEALTPTGKKLTKALYDSLKINEKNVYNEIIWRFLANFYPKAEYDVLNIEIERKEEKFVKKNKILSFLGFYKVYGKELDKKEDIKLKAGDNIEITDFSIQEGKTEPPKRLTEGALIKVMQSPLKYVETKEDKETLKDSGGLGTEATRAGIIENMKKYGFIELKKNTIYVTENGMKLIDLIPGNTIKSVPLTASFESKLKSIVKGEHKREEVLKDIKEIVDAFVIDVKNLENKKGFEKTMDNEICKCPECGSSIVEGRYGFNCQDYKNCKVQIYFNAVERLGGKNITKTQAKELLTLGKTKKKVKLHSAKTDKDYEAFLTYSFKPTEKYPNSIGITFE